MELDSRIVEGKRPLTCFDIEEAKKQGLDQVTIEDKDYEEFNKLLHEEDAEDDEE